MKPRIRTCLEVASIRGGALDSLWFFVPLSLLAAFVLVLFSLAPPAIAARGHVFCETCTFGSPGSGPGKFNEPAGLAVNEATTEANAGYVYVVDKGNNRVEVFDAKGKYQFEFNGSGTLPNDEGKAAPETLCLLFCIPV